MLKPIDSHFQDLRVLIIKLLSTLAVFIIPVVIFNKLLLELIIDPLLNSQSESSNLTTLNFLNPIDPFLFRVDIVLFCTTLVSLPVIIYFLIQYLSPVFSKQLRSRLIIITITSFLIIIASVIFAYKLIIPHSLRYFIDLGNSLDTTQTSITATGYLKYFKTILIASVVTFQLPIINYLLIKSGIIKIELITKNRKIAYISLLTVLFFITPGDISVSIFLVVPIIVLFELSILASR